MKEEKPYIIRELVDENGVNHFQQFLKSVSSPIDRAKIRSRLNRLSQGNLGLYEDLKDGVYELKFKGNGPGCRVYFGKEGHQIIILIGGGIKRGQQRDIDSAKSLWRAWLATGKE